MNSWQQLKEMRYLLAADVWPDGAGEKVWGGVLATAGVAESYAFTSRLPLVALNLGASVNDDQDPDYIRQQYAARIVVAVAGDMTGEAALIGGSRTGGQGSSRGRGLAELEERFTAKVGQIVGNNGIRIAVVESSAAQAAQLEDLGYVVYRDYVLEGLASRARYYAPPCRLAATAAGGGNVSLSWTLPATRYDTLSVILRRAAGATAPASATAGTSVSLSSALATSKTDNPGAGQFSYALFLAYDETGAGSAERYSDQVTGTTKTVTAT